MNKMRDDQEFNINFVKIIEKERCLYDKTLSEYRSKEVHDQIWKRISSEVKESGELCSRRPYEACVALFCMTDVTSITAPKPFLLYLHFVYSTKPRDFPHVLLQFSVPHCKERWRNLRACLTRHLKQQLYASDGSVFHKPYYLAEHMKFVLPFTKSRSSTGKDGSIYIESTSHSASPLKDTKEVAIHLASSEDTEPPPEHDSKHFQHDEPPTYTISAAESDDNNQYVTFVQNANGELTPEQLDSNQLHVDGTSTIIATKTIHHPNYASGTKPIDIYEPSVKRVRLSNQETDDADLNFFRSLLPDIRLMTASQKRRFKMGIFQLIDNVLKNTDANI